VCKGRGCRCRFSREDGLDFGVPKERRERRVEILDDFLLRMIDFEPVRSVGVTATSSTRTSVSPRLI
jgi:hypothetical protein